MYADVFYRHSAEAELHAASMPLIEGQDANAWRSLKHSPRSTWADCALPDLLECGPSEVNAAVQAAVRCFADGQWSGLSKMERKAAIARWADSLASQVHALAALCCVDTGRAWRNFVEESIPKAIACLRWFMEAYDKQEDKLLTGTNNGDLLCMVRREPLGVVAAILPWNDPLVTLVWKVAPALLLGNSVVVKPSEYASLAVQRALALAHAAGVPVGALQLLTGGAHTGALLVAQAQVQAIAFTGSTSTATKIGMSALATGLKKLAFECGGKSPLIIDRHSGSLKDAATLVANNMFYNQGQICSAPSRVYVDATRFEDFLALLHEASKSFVPQHPLSDTSVGLMVSQNAAARVRGHIALAKASGLRCVSACEDTALTCAERSVAPTILCHVDEDNLALHAELFGPVVILNSYQTMDEAVAKANNSSYGLAAGIWSDDINAALLVAQRLQSGVVHINSWGDDDNQMPFGGIKNSGTGKEKSAESFDAYSYLKATNLKLRSHP